mgnify:CR=1 FL=1
MNHLLIKSDTPALKQFALTMAWAFPAVFSGLLPWLFEFNVPLWPLTISVGFLLLWAFIPRWIYYPYRVWMAIAGILGWVNTRLILGLSFYVLIAPFGLVLQLFGKLQYRSKLPYSTNSNYVEPEAKSIKQNLEHPF